MNNFEVVATSLFALFLFKEAIGKRMWFAIGLITVASIVLTIEDTSRFKLSLGSIFVLLALRRLGGNIFFVFAALGLGFVTYGFSFFFYFKAQPGNRRV